MPGRRPGLQLGGIARPGNRHWRRAEKENDYENEERSRAEEWPTEYTEYTERGTGGGRRKRTITRTRNENDELVRSRAEDWPTEYTERGAEFLTTKHPKDTKGGGRGPECLPANYAKGREWGKRESEEWPTEYTEGGRDPEAEGGEVGVNLICGRGRGGGWRERPLANRRDLN